MLLFVVIFFYIFVIPKSYNYEYIQTFSFSNSFSLLILSFSKDDKTDPLIGLWQLEHHVENGKESALSDCEKITTLEFKSDGTAIETIFRDENGCRSKTFNLTWKKIDSKTVHLSYVEDGDTDVEKYTYSISNGKLTLDEILDAGGTPYKLVLKKIK